MTNNETKSSEIELEQRRFDLQSQVLRLMNDTKLPIRDIARMLNAENFLQSGPKGSVTFKVKDWSNDEVTRATSENRPIVKLPFLADQINETILPPGQGEIITGSGNGDMVDFDNRNIIHRTKALIDLLSGMNLNYKLINGTNDPNMIRQLSYTVVILPEKQKVIFVNDEENNATYIVHDVTENWKTYQQMTKDELKEQMVSGKVSRVVFDKSMDGWKNEISQIITADFGNTQIQKNLVSKKTPAPEGWMTNSGLATTLRSTYDTIKRIAERHRNNHPEWFSGEYVDKLKRPAEHLSPKLIEIISKELSEKTPAPDGWLTNTGLAAKLNTHIQTTERIANLHRVGHPEWFSSEYVDKKNKKAEHFAPKLVEIITKELSDKTPAPTGWITNGNLSKTSGSAFKTIQKIAKPYRTSHPEWFSDKYSDKTNKPTEHFAPELVDIIIKEINERKK